MKAGQGGRSTGNKLEIGKKKAESGFGSRMLPVSLLTSPALILSSLDTASFFLSFVFPVLEHTMFHPTPSPSWF